MFQMHLLERKQKQKYQHWAKLQAHTSFSHLLLMRLYSPYKFIHLKTFGTWCNVTFNKLRKKEQTVIKAASGDERALAPPRPPGSAAVREKARRRSKHRVQRNKFVKMMVQLH